MDNTHNLKVGEKIELLLNENEKVVKFLSKVEEVENDTFVITKPISENRYDFLPKDKVVKVVFYRDDGVYYFNAKVIERIKNRETFSDKMYILSDKHKLQRRNYYRLREMVSAKISYSTDDKNIVMDSMTVDISGGGIKIVSSDIISTNTKLKIVLDIKNIKDCEISGKVIRCVPSQKQKNMFEISIELIDMKLQIRQEIIKYIYKKQCKILKNVGYIG